MKSENAFDYLCAGSCHVSDGELLDGHRVGCADLVYYDSAVSAIEQAERDVEDRMRRKAISAFDDMWFENGEDGWSRDADLRGSLRLRPRAPLRGCPSRTHPSRTSSPRGPGSSRGPEARSLACRGGSCPDDRPAGRSRRLASRRHAAR